MNNPNGIKTARMNAINPDTPAASIDAPATESELEALRYRGTPIRRSVPDATPPQDAKTIAPDGLRHPEVVNCEAAAENISSEDTIPRVLEKLPLP